jgi:transposase-like protein
VGTCRVGSGPTSCIATYEQLKSGRATARVHGVSHETVQRLVKATQAAYGRDPRELVGDCW